MVQILRITRTLTGKRRRWVRFLRILTKGSLWVPTVLSQTAWQIAKLLRDYPTKQCLRLIRTTPKHARSCIDVRFWVQLITQTDAWGHVERWCGARA